MGLDATNVVGVIVADASGAVDLTGTFQTPVVTPPHEFCKFVLLARTTNAPANAMGRAVLEFEPSEGTNATLGVETSGPAHRHLHGEHHDTASNTYTLGTFDVKVWTNLFAGPMSPGDDNECLRIRRSQFSPPAGVDPTNVVTVAIADTNGMVDLTGDFTNRFGRPCSFNTLVPLTQGPAGMNVWGTPAWISRHSMAKHAASFH